MKNTIVYIDDESDKISDYLDALFYSFPKYKTEYFDTLYFSSKYIYENYLEIAIIIADVMFESEDRNYAGRDAGILFYHTLRSDEKFSEIPIILLTNRTKESLNHDLIPKINRHGDKLFEKSSVKSERLVVEIEKILRKKNENKS